MAEHWFDPADPPRQPPPDVRQPLMWWMGVRLVTDHRPRRALPWHTRPSCRSCGRSWPCPPHRLGARGLLAARDELPEDS